MVPHPTAADEPDIYHDVDAPTTSPTEYRRVALATMVGTTIEWYDFFIYANVAALLFGKLFFSGLGDWKDLVSFATIGVSFFFRPAGAIAMGYVGDRWGRRMVLVFTLILMGLSTALVGCLPTTQSIGIAAPVLLILLRCLQGFSAGGEWGGAAMLAVEHAPHGRRGRFGAYPQIGVPLGMMIATAFLTVLSATTTKAQFEAWGWRIPFLFSIVLVLVGHYIRHRVEESPVFEELKEAREHAAVPQTTLVRHHLGDVVKAAASFMGNNALGYMLVGGFVLAYATKSAKPPLARTDVLVWVMVSAALWIVTTLWGAALSDRIGRKRVYQIGYVLMILGMYPMFMAVREGTLVWVAAALVWIAIPEGLTYGPQAALFAEAFPAHIRLSAVSMAYAIGAVFGGAFAPMIAEAITKQTGSVVHVAWYLGGVALVSLLAVSLMPDRTNEPLHTMSGH